MVLIDFTQTIIAGLMAQLKMNGGEVSEDMLRHMILNSVRNYQKKYAPDYGEIVLCTDASIHGEKTSIHYTKQTERRQEMHQT
jgi:hypothetical protein